MRRWTLLRSIALVNATFALSFNWVNRSKLIAVEDYKTTPGTPLSFSRLSTMDYTNFITIALLLTLLGAVLAEDSAENNTALESLNEQTCSKKVRTEVF